MNGLYDLMAGGLIGLVILGMNWWVVYIDRPRRLRSYQIKTGRTVEMQEVCSFDESGSERAKEVALLQSELRFQG